MEPDFLDLGEVQLHYRIDGPPRAPWLVFCNSLGTDLSMWEAQVDALGEHFRILRYDQRGHGLSSSPPSPYTIAELGSDVLGLLDELGIERAHFCGLSIGGLVGQWLALHAPSRFDRLVLASTAGRIGTEAGWRARIAEVRDRGLGSIAAGTVERWFTPAFAGHAPEVVKEILGRLQQTSLDAYVGCCEALVGADFRALAGAIRSPVLAIAGAEDPVTAPADLEAIARRVPTGSLCVIPGRHLCNIESAAAFNDAMASFLTGSPRTLSRD